MRTSRLTWLRTTACTCRLRTFKGFHFGKLVKLLESWWWIGSNFPSLLCCQGGYPSPDVNEHEELKENLPQACWNGRDPTDPTSRDLRGPWLQDKAQEQFQRSLVASRLLWFARNKSCNLFRIQVTYFEGLVAGRNSAAKVASFFLVYFPDNQLMTPSWGYYQAIVKDSPHKMHECTTVWMKSVRNLRQRHGGQFWCQAFSQAGESPWSLPSEVCPPNRITECLGGQVDITAVTAVTPGEWCEECTSLTAENVRFEGGPGSSWMSKQHCRGGSKNLRNKAQFDTISSHGILKPFKFHAF